MSHTFAIPRGAPLDSQYEQLSVLSYNLLAPLFVRPIDLRTGAVQPFAAFEWASEEDLDWEKRQKKILEQLTSWHADVVCLQEVQFCTQEDGSFTLPTWLELPGYSACVPGDKYLLQIAERNERVLASKTAIGCALLFRSDRLQVVGDEGGNDPNTLVSACLAGHPDAELRLGKTAFFSVHLDAQSEENRVEQLRKCLERARAMGTRDAVLAGDMNTECLSGSCVRAYVSSDEPTADEILRECTSGLRITDDGEDAHEEGMSKGMEPSAEQLREWKALWQKAAKTPDEHRMILERVPTGPTRSSYEHGMSEGPCVTWSLDHVFYSPRTLKLQGHWTALEADAESAASGLPNRENPSDHLPVAAVFQVSPTPALETLQRQALLARLEQLEHQQEQELADLEVALKALEPVVQEVEGKKSKKDPPEMIAFKQEKRRKTKALKAEHVAQRKDFWGSLSDLELDVVEDLCGSLWPETGARG